MILNEYSITKFPALRAASREQEVLPATMSPCKAGAEYTKTACLPTQRYDIAKKPAFIKVGLL